MRRIAVPPHRYAPLKEKWMSIYTPVVEQLHLQMRFELKSRNVEIKVVFAVTFYVGVVLYRGRPNFGFGSAPNVDKWALSADVRFRPKAVIQHSVHFRFRRAAVGKFGDCRK